MAIGKPRTGKRSSSSSSYLSTVIMVVFIALCALGLWMLTSSSVVPPETTRTSNAFASSKPLRSKDPPVFDDTQGDLPDDAIKGDAEDSKSDEQSDQEVKTATAEQEGKAESKTDEAMDNGNDEKGESSVVEERKESSEDEGQQQKQVSEESNDTVENQQISSTTGAREDENNVESNETPERTKADPQLEQQDTEVEARENQQQTAQHETQIENRQQSQQDTEAESSENPAQTSPETQQEPEIESSDNPQPTKQESEIENHEKNSSETGEENQEQAHPQQQISQLDIQEVTSEEPQQQQRQQRDFQEAEINEDQQYQQTPVENSPVESKEPNNQSETENNNSNRLEIQQVTTDNNSGGSIPGGAQSGIPKESNESKASWSTQADQSQNQKGRSNNFEHSWELCNVTAGADYIPCLDNEHAIRRLHSRRHFEHRERHCPEEGPKCLVPVPEGYKRSIEWPKSRDKIWYHNVPHTKLAEVKGHQNWVKVTGEFLTFPGGGTQFIHGALHYIDFIQKSVPKIAWGKHTRVILDVGCGVASFGGYLFERDVLAMSFAPKDEHEAQVQFALERGIPAISAVMGSQRLPFPSRVFDMVHCARCRVPWHVEGGALLLELNRVLRPGGYFVWSATPVYQKLPEDTEIWKAMSSLTRSMCWDLVTIKKDKLNGVGVAIYHKPSSNECYEQRKRNSPPMCKGDDDPNAAWYVPLQSCLHRVPMDSAKRGSQWPENWPLRVHKPPYWLNTSQKGIYGKPAPDDFAADYEHWKRVVTQSYMSGLGISWSNVRNVMDMRAVYGGFAAALKDLKVWVMNVVNINSPDTLPIIYERGLFGIYHDWCESFSTYPRTYDLLHADHLFSRLKKRCNLLPVMAEVDRIVRPGGKLIVRDESSILGEVENILKSLHWEIHLTFAKDQEGMLSAQKTDWRP